MATWIRKEQEFEGDHYFDGYFFVTPGVQQRLTAEEIQTIYGEIQELVKEHNGLDYLQVFENESGDKLFFINSMGKQALEDNNIDPTDMDYNNCTLMLSSEY